jgi:hypothetical protein
MNTNETDVLNGEVTGEGVAVEAEVIQEKGAEAPEYSEEGLHELVDSATANVEDRAGRVLENADKAAEPPSSLKMDAGKAASIFKQKGFLSQVQGIKEKITALAISTKAKIAGLLSGDGRRMAEKEADTVVAQEAALTEGAQSSVSEEAARVPVEQHEAVPVEPEEALEQKEQRELLEFLEKEAFPKLGLTKEEEARVLAETREEKKELTERSFANVRATVKAFLEHYSTGGVVDSISLDKDKADIEESLFREFAARHKDQYAINDADIESLAKKHDISELSSRGYEVGGKTDEQYESIRNLQNEYAMELMQRSPNIAAYRKRFSKEELLQQLESERSVVENNHAVTINIGWKPLLSVLQEGKFKSANELTSEQAKKLEKEQFRHLSQSYIDTRTNLEKEMGFKGGDCIIYGTLANTQGIEGRIGGASSYGDIFLEMDSGPDTTYTEGDSYTSNATGAGRQKERNEGYGAQNITHRQLYGHTAYISKAVDNIERNMVLQYNQVNTTLFTYIEAQIPNPSLDQIKAINVPKKRAAGVLYKLSELPDGEKWKAKVKVIDE